MSRRALPKLRRDCVTDAPLSRQPFSARRDERRVEASPRYAREVGDSRVGSPESLRTRPLVVEEGGEIGHADVAIAVEVGVAVSRSSLGLAGWWLGRLKGCPTARDRLPKHELGAWSNLFSNDLQQFDVEDERRLGGNERRLAALAIPQIVRNDELALGADVHRADAFRPTSDDTVERE